MELCVPATPIRHLIQSWLDKEGNDIPKLMLYLYPEGEARTDRDRILAILRGRTKNIDFDLADLVLCRLDYPELWLEDPILSKAYAEVDFAALDRARPTCLEAA